MSMTDLDTKSGTTLAGWLAAAETRAAKSGEAGWLQERRKAAASTTASMKFPSRNDELWRRTDLGGLQLEPLDPFAVSAKARNIDDLPTPIIERLAGEAANVGLIVQRDSEVVLEQTHPTLTKQGITLCSLDRAAKEHAALLQPYFGKLIDTDYDRWTALGEAVRSGGMFVHVPKGVHAELPVRLFQWIEGAGRMAAPRTVIVVEPGASLTVLDEMLSDPAEAASMHIGGTEAFVGDGGKLTYAHLQDWGRNVYHYSNARAQLGRDAELQWIQVMVGGRITKANAYYDMNGSGGQAFVHGFMFGDHRQHFHLHTLQRHLQPHCTSDLMIKGCLKDKARSVYQGLIQVAEGAQRTDAYQANRNLLLSNEARADSIPGLEILANDVRCTHGATLGHIENEHLYYLMARGLPLNVAQRLVVEAFFEPVLDRIPLESVRERLRGEIAHKIG